MGTCTRGDQCYYRHDPHEFAIGQRGGMSGQPPTVFTFKNIN